MTSRVDHILADQAVHGYSNGHRLLAASRVFGKAADRQLRILSDLSGPRSHPNFDAYFTAYSLEEGSSFAIGKTWIAPEMERPGCVWTHTLVFAERDLAEIRSIRNLTNSFVRPTPNNLESFESAKTIQLSSDSAACDVALPDAPTSRLIEALYAKTTPLFLIAEMPGDFSEVIIAVWLQHLRMTSRAISFCTASIRSRKVDATPLVIQAIPPDAVRDAQDSSSDATFLTASEIREYGEVSDWAKTLANDCARFENHGVTRFVSHYFDNSPKSEVAALADVSESLSRAEQDDSRVLALATSMAESWPEPTASRRLKQDVFGPPDRRKFLSDTRDIVLLDAVLHTGVSPAFMLHDFDVASRLKDACTYAPSPAMRILKDHVESRGDEAFDTAIEVLVETVSVDSVDDLCGFPEAVVLGVLLKRPALLASPTIWESQDTAKLLEVLRECGELDHDVLNGIVAAQLEASTTGVAATMEGLLKRNCVQPVLKWASLRSVDVVPAEWWHVVDKHPEDTCRWLDTVSDVSPVLVARVTSHLDPRGKYIAGCPLSSWVSHADSARSHLAEPEQTRLMTFFVSLALNTRKRKGADLIGIGFRRVYQALQNGSLDRRAWDTLRRDLPNRLLWDECKRLRVGVVEHFSRCDWPVDPFLDAVPDAGFLRDTLGMWGWSKSETEFLGRVLRRGLEQSRGTNEANRAVLSEYQRWFRVS